MSWIISRRDDLLWFHGSVLAALALGAFFAWGPHPAFLVALLAWGVLFDGTHVFGTYARTWLAPGEEAPDARSFLLLLIGPTAALLHHFIIPIFPIFLLTAYLWAYWHLVRQHWGFIALYRRGQPTRLGWLLWLGCVYPFVRFGLSDAYAASGMPLLFPAAALPQLRLGLDLVALGALVMIGILRLLDRRPPRLGPAHLYTALAVGLHLVTFALLRELLPITATLNLFHNLQYHRIVWHHEARRGRKPFGGLGRYLAAGILLGLVWYVPRIMVVSAVPSLARDLVIGACWGVAFHHYFVDARIWRLRQPALRRVLLAA